MVEFLAACVVAGTPLVFATVGELITEKSGSMNLGVEGMMLMGAVMGFLASINTYNPAVALLAAALAGRRCADLRISDCQPSCKSGRLRSDTYHIWNRLRTVCRGTASGFQRAIGHHLVFCKAVDSAPGRHSGHRADLLPAGYLRLHQLHRLCSGSSLYVQDEDRNEPESSWRKQCGGRCIRHQRGTV